MRRDKDTTNIVTVKLSDIMKKSKLTFSGRSVWQVCVSGICEFTTSHPIFLCQVEAEHVGVGSIINWNTSCRLKHIASGQYLCIKQELRNSVFSQKNVNKVQK